MRWCRLAERIGVFLVELSRKYAHLSVLYLLVCPLALISIGSNPPGIHLSGQDTYVVLKNAVYTGAL